MGSMYKNLLSVGFFTLLSRGTGFFRDVALGAVLGAGMLADAFYIAFRLPNHFRTIFGEGAFNAAYVPSYSRVLESEGGAAAKSFSSQIFTLLLASQVLLLALALLFTPQLIELLAPGFEADPEKMRLAVTMTQITFPYLLFITLVTLHSGTLNANGRFAAAAFAPVLLNLVMLAFLAIAFLFPDAGIAASYGITVSGVAQLALLMVAARRAGVLEGLERPRLDFNVKQFFSALGPAVIGSAGVQIALFADTIIGSMLPTGGISSIYYADRIYQLPIGVIGIAAGTVLLPEMSRRRAAGDHGAACHAQNRTMALTLALAAPFFVAFLAIPDLIMRGVFLRGRFTAEAAAASAAVLAAYGVGILAIVLIRSAVASFQAQGDTRTPMLVALLAVAINVALKIVLFRPLRSRGPRDGDGRRRLDQFRPPLRARHPPGLDASRCDARQGRRRGRRRRGTPARCGDLRRCADGPSCRRFRPFRDRSASRASDRGGLGRLCFRPAHRLARARRQAGARQRRSGVRG